MSDSQESGKPTRRKLLQGMGAASVLPAVSISGCSFLDGNGDDDEVSFPLEVQLETNSDNPERVEMVEVIADTMNESDYFDASVETYEFNDFTQRVLNPEYGERGHIGAIGLSGTFNPESFCNALNHSNNIGQCCNLSGVNDEELDQLMDSARFGSDVAEDEELRQERYDEVWQYLAEEAYSSMVFFDVNAAMTNNNVHGYSVFPFNENIISYALYSPQDEQVMWMDESSDPRETDLSDLQEGGTLRAAIAENPASFDYPYSSSTTATLAQSLIFEGLTTTDIDGNVMPWLARTFETTEIQDVERTDYEDYMETVAANDEGAIDTDEQILIQHPDDDPVADDEVRVLLPDGAADAVADGLFGMEVQYELHEGVEFHNGEELTSENVVRTFEYLQNSDLSAQTFDSVLHVEAVDEYTANIYGQVPDAEGERELPGTYILSVENIEEADPEPGAGGDIIDPRSDITPYGTGPYTLEDFQDEQYVEYAKFDNYWLDQQGVDTLEWFDGPEEFPDGPVIDEISFEIVPDPATRSASLQNDEVDMTYDLEKDTFSDYDESDDYMLYTMEAGGYTYLQAPLQVEPWDDRRMRQAFNHLINREYIVQNIHDGYGREAWTPLPEIAYESGTADPEALEEEIRPYNEYDPEGAVELIEEVIDERGYASDV